MAPKPSNTPDWIPDNTTGIIIPGTSKQSAGWFKEERPPYQFFNWFWNIVSQFIHYLSGQAEYNIIIDTDANEGDYTTLAAYIADSPAAGDRVLVKVDTTITAEIVLPDNILLKIQKGKKFTCSTALGGGNSAIKLGSNTIIEGVIWIELSHSSGLTEYFIHFNDDNSRVDEAIMHNTSTGTVTSAIASLLGRTGNYARGIIINDGGGTLLRTLIANENDNDYVVRGPDDIIHRSGLYRIKLTPKDFVSTSPGNNTETIGTSGGDVTAAGVATDLIATKDIPQGYKATHVRVYASTTLTVNAYEGDINNNTTTSKGTGDTTAEINITDVPSDTTNYLAVEVVAVNGADVYGGYITIEAI